MIDPYFLFVASLAMLSGILIGYAIGYEAGRLAAKWFYESQRRRGR